LHVPSRNFFVEHEQRTSVKLLTDEEGEGAKPRYRRH
jgi:hypothetical protein